MLTSLDFLARGRHWPPEGEEKRLERYRDNRLLFEDEHAEVYRYEEQMQRVERVIGNFSRVISYTTILSYQKLMSLKIADLVFGEPPKITTAKEGQQAVIDQILTNTNLLNSAYMCAIDVSRYGDGLLLLGNRDGVPVVDAISPRNWYPVVDPINMRHILYHVFAWAYPVDVDGTVWELRVQVHSPENPGNCEQIRYKLEGSGGAWSIGEKITKENEQMLETQLKICPVFRVPNTLTSDRIFGIDDYQSVDSIISELMVRISQVSKVLDKHANPSMSGPDSALEQDQNTGEYRLRVGNYYVQNTKDDPTPQYITWDASMTANFQQIELLINQLYTISEMGSAIFGDLTSKIGTVPSGSALRRLMMSPLAKARRIANGFDSALKGLISACAAIYGTHIDIQNISIKWNDGLPDDEEENARIMSIRTSNRPTISQHTAIRRLDELGEEDAAAELDEIRADDAAQDMGTEAKDESEESEEKPESDKDEDDDGGDE